MKKSILLVLFCALSALFTGCSQKNKLTPPDTIVGGNLNDKGWVEGSGNYGRGGNSGDGSDTTGGAGSFNRDLEGDDVLTSRSGDLDEIEAILANDDNIFDSVYFGFDQYSIPAEERGKVTAVAEELKSNPQSKMIAEGHTDWRGTEQYNLGLGDRRANSVKQFLISLGIPEDRIDVRSLGELESTGDVSKDAPEAVSDRRVDIFVY